LEEFWALRDINFEVPTGEAVGIIGRNGAGKSTLLKILSRITKPSRGQVAIRGRVGSLLEVGTGFHPELTGRENIYLNGSILGMRRREIRRRFDEIVAFAEVERFLDTPVKRFSSGMYVRLAFAVAAHLEPEILLVDEVLAVGDAQFQRRCLGKMEGFANQGRTVFFVSHQMSAVRRLCSRAMLLDKGRVAAYGPNEGVIASYLAAETVSAPEEWLDLAAADRSGNQQARFLAVHYRCPDKRAGDYPYPDGPLEVSVRIASDAHRVINGLAVAVFDRYGTLLINGDTVSIGQAVTLRSGVNEFVVSFAQLHLKPGGYTIGLCLANYPLVFDLLPAACNLEVRAYEESTLGRTPPVDGFVTCDFAVTGPY
jgi:ABC-type polysaccharide/polyol phosphate transport system ATPase subunit